MKIADMRELSADELNAKLADLNKELFSLRFSHAAGQLANPMVIKNTKKDIAKIKTLITERKNGKTPIKTAAKPATKKAAK